MKELTYKITVTNTKTNESGIRYCKTDKGFAHATSIAMQSVEDDTIRSYLPDKWEISVEIIYTPTEIGKMIKA